MTSPPPFDINLASGSDGAVHVEVRGELDLSTSPELGEVLQRELGAGRRVVVDLSKVTFIDSTALNTLVDALRLAEADGGSLKVSAELPAQIKRVFAITGLDGVFPVSAE